MKRFKFKLQTLLERRISIEEERTRELAEVLAEEQAQKLRLQELEQQTTEAFVKLHNELSKTSIEPAKIGGLDEYARGCLEDTENQEAIVNEVHTRVLSKQQEVVEAMKDRKTLETLKEKQMAAHNLAQMREEQAALDDISALRFARGMRHA